MDLTPLFSHNLDPGLVISPVENRILEANQAACELLGHSHEALLSVKASTLFESTLPVLITFSQSLMEQKRGWTECLEVETRDGERIPIECNGVAASIDGMDILILNLRSKAVIERRQSDTMIRDYIEGGIIEWMRVEKLFKEFEQQNELILKAAGEGIYGVKLQGGGTGDTWLD